MKREQEAPCFSTGSITLEYEIRGNLLLIQKYPLHLYYKLITKFTYDRIGYDRIQQKKLRTPEIVATGYDTNGAAVDLGLGTIPQMIVTFHGYEPGLIEFAKQNKLKLSKKTTKLLDDKVFVPQWDNVPPEFEFRYMQKEVIEVMAQSDGGVMLFPTGYGKTNIIGILPCVFPEARILVCSYRKQVYSEIASRLKKFVLPGTKMFVQGTKPITHSSIQQSRVVVCGNKSLAKVLSYGDNYDLMLLDEAHQACAPDTFKILATVIRPKIFGLTGSFNRSDGAQFRLLGLCGPVIMEVDMKKATEEGLVVPIQVLWCPVQLQYDPVAGCHAAYKKHRGIWHNAFRNKLIAGAARSYDENTQVLIMVETIKHAMALKALLPEFFVVSSETPDLDRVRGAFKKGTMKKIIATPTWNQGVDFPNLAVLINATGVKSEIANIQLTGRVSRLGDDKAVGIVHDFFDTWNPEFRYFANERKKLYDRQGYTQNEILATELLQNL